MKALVIEDDQVQSKWTCYCLEELGFTTVTCSNGFAGIKKAIEIKPDLIILDLTLPGLPGIDTLMEIKKDQPTCVIPVITVTADLIGTLKKEVMELGGIYLVKPISIEKMSFYVKKLIEAFIPNN